AGIVAVLVTIPLLAFGLRLTHVFERFLTERRCARFQRAHECAIPKSRQDACVPSESGGDMYTEFYELKELPFALTPDPRYIYFTPSHTEVMANLHYGIESGRGLIVVTGEVGTGKTTMLRWVMQRLDRRVLHAYIFNPRLSVPEFYQHLAALFDIQDWETKSDLLIELGKVLDSRHSRGLRTVLIVDEAHGLSPAVLEEVRLL